MEKDFIIMMKKRLREIEKKNIGPNRVIKKLIDRIAELHREIKKLLPGEQKELVSELSILEGKLGYMIEEIVYRHAFYDGLETGSVERLISRLRSQAMEEFEQTVGKLLKELGGRLQIETLLNRWAGEDKKKLGTLLETISKDMTTDEILSRMAFEDMDKLKRILKEMIDAQGKPQNPRSPHSRGSS